MASYLKMSKDELQSELSKNQEVFKNFVDMNLKLNMARGKPGNEQLDIASEILTCITDDTNLVAIDGTDCRNYGLVDGLPEAKKLFSEMMNVQSNQIIVASNSSLNLMYDTIMRFMLFGTSKDTTPWSKQDKIKFLCPSPGYDRHFAICEQFGIEMITIDMKNDGPDMDTIEKLVSEDDTIKGIWCVPKYSNPDGITYSDKVIERFALLKPKANDFIIMWDNAYTIHHLYDEEIEIPSIINLCKTNNCPNRVYVYSSTSKISFPGAGVAMMASSEENINYMKSLMGIQTIGPDKLNQLRHVLFFKNLDGIKTHMKKHAQILRPKFEIVIDSLEKELADLEIAQWNNPKGGYFISLYTLDGTAKRIANLCKEAGVILTSAGATYPYGKDPRDRNLRIAPTFPPVSELKIAMDVLTTAVKIACIEVLLNK